MLRARARSARALQAFIAGTLAATASSSGALLVRVRGGGGGAGEVQHPFDVVADDPVMRLDAAQRVEVVQDARQWSVTGGLGGRVALAAGGQDVGGDQAEGGDVVQGADADAAAMGVPVQAGVDAGHPLAPFVGGSAGVDGGAGDGEGGDGAVGEPQGAGQRPGVIEQALAERQGSVDVGAGHAGLAAPQRERLGRGDDRDQAGDRAEQLAEVRRGEVGGCSRAQGAGGVVVGGDQVGRAIDQRPCPRPVTGR